jgi:hypothetical protein
MAQVLESLPIRHKLRIQIPILAPKINVSNIFLSVKGFIIT